jgi:hypothetical protein
MPRKQLRPPIKLRKRYAALIELCRNKILTAPPQTSGTGSGDALITVCIKWPAKQGGAYGSRNYLVPDLPTGFPQGVFVSKAEDGIVIRHNCVLVLKWFKERAYCNFDAADLFAQRLPVLMRLAKHELKLNRMLESVDIEQQTQEMLDE